MKRCLILVAAVLMASIAWNTAVQADTSSQNYAQFLVNRALRAHPHVLVMAMHVTPPGRQQNVIIASNIGRIGKPADADDLRVIKTGKPNLEVNRRGNRFEVEMPLLDVTGDIVGALSVVYPYKAGDDKFTLRARAENIRDQLERRISNQGNLTQAYRFDASVPVDTYAQQLIDRTLAAHPGLLILMMHVVPPGGASNLVVASNIGRIGKKADDDDMRVIRTGTPNLEVNGDRFEVEARLLDRAGQTIGAVGIVFPYAPGDDKAALERRGLAIRDELRARIPSVAGLLRPVPDANAMPPASMIGRTTDWHPGYSGDFDHFGIDIQRKRLFLAAEDHGTLEVFNLATGRHERTLHDVQTPHAIVYLPRHHRLIVTDSGKGMTKVLDSRNYKTLGHIALAEGADSADYDPSRHRLYIVTGGKDVGMKHCFLNEVNPFTGRVYRKLRFDSDHTEAVRAEQHGDRLFVNVADKDLVAVVSKKNLKVIARWHLKGAKTNLTMALDEADHRLFVGTRNPSKLFVLDTRTGATVAVLDAPATSDGLFFDAAQKRIYLPGGDGYLGVFRQVDPDRYTQLARIPTAVGAKSGILVPELQRLYLAVSPGDRGKGGAVLTFALNP